MATRLYEAGRKMLEEGALEVNGSSETIYGIVRHLEKSIDELDKSVDRLTGVLIPIIKPIEMPVKGDMFIDSDSLSPLAQMLVSIANRINGIRSSIDSTTKKIDLGE